jgi:hypothetical protein
VKWTCAPPYDQPHGGRILGVGEPPTPSSLQGSTSLTLLGSRHVPGVVLDQQHTPTGA